MIGLVRKTSSVVDILQEEARSAYTRKDLYSVHLLVRWECDWESNDREIQCSLGGLLCCQAENLCE